MIEQNNHSTLLFCGSIPLSALQILNAIAVRITPPEDEKKDWSYQIGAAWPTDQEEVIKFTSQVDHKFNKSSKSYAQFARPYLKNSFPGNLLEHLDGKLNFLAFIDNFVQKKLIISAKKSRASNGAVLVFTHYKSEFVDDNGKSNILHERLLVLMLKNADALRFKENLQLNPVDIIDLDKFLQGARIDALRFVSDDEEEKEKNNLCFIRGSGDVRQYFIESIGADNVVSNQKSSEQCILALNTFVKEHQFPRALREKIDSKITELFNSFKRGQTVSLDKIQTQIDALIPEEYAEHKGSFVEFVNENGFEVNEEFEITAKEKKQLEWLDFETAIAKLSVKKHQIGLPNSDCPVIFDEETNEIRITQKVTDPIIIAKLKEFANE
ncbi:nucleoid-associated protein [Citrobacter portucalensis]|uniref:nucleoid-associated protein n=1 Tax=Citrobacter portucalensis TaxID=1639133 RepID=UPI001E6127D5|nr:nucleoid-associated protein [Citrobacter portucalensis]